MPVRLGGTFLFAATAETAWLSLAFGQYMLYLAAVPLIGAIGVETAARRFAREHPPSAPAVGADAAARQGGAMAPLTWHTALTAWQFAPLVSAALATAALLYAAGVVRVRRRHPARPWPLSSSLSFAGGLAVVAVATQSSVGAYDDVLFSDHMVQHVLLIMAAAARHRAACHPRAALLGQLGPRAGQAGHPVQPGDPRDPSGDGGSAVMRGRGGHSHAAVHGPRPGERGRPRRRARDLPDHGLHLLLVVIGSEPVRHRVSAVGAFLMLLITMLVDSGTGVAYTLQSHEVFSPYAHLTRTWGPGPVTDLHLGGYIMFIGSDLIMTTVAVALAARFLRAETPSTSDPALGAYNRYLQALAVGKRC